MDLDVSDRITLTISGSAAVQDAARHHEALIAGETLATTFTVVDHAGGADRVETVTVGEDHEAGIAVSRVVASSGQDPRRR